jgi:hypothetical protein
MGVPRKINAGQNLYKILIEKPESCASTKG